MAARDAARSLSLPLTNESPRHSHDTYPDSPLYQTPSRSSHQHYRSPHPRSRWRQSARTAQTQWAAYLRFVESLTPLQKAGFVAASLLLGTLGILFLVFSSRIFAALGPVAVKWRALPAGWLILWVAVFCVSFPPMVGYSTCITLAGFVFGVWRGWLIMASATVLGSAAAFLASRTVLRGYATRLAEGNKRFAALALVLKHDGIKLLIMIRLCPLPYSLSNGVISTIPTVTPLNFMLATAIAAPKIVLGVFVGSRLGDLAENGDKMDAWTKAVSYIGILIGVVAGIGTGYLVYVRTQARARQLEAEEAAASGEPGHRRISDGGAPIVYRDGVDGEEGRGNAFDNDNISMHTQGYRDEEEGGVDGWRGYRDEDSLDDDAQERDVFDEGDGGFESDEGKGKRGVSP